MSWTPPCTGVPVNTPTFVFTPINPSAGTPITNSLILIDLNHDGIPASFYVYTYVPEEGQIDILWNPSTLPGDGTKICIGFLHMTSASSGYTDWYCGTIQTAARTGTRGIGNLTYCRKRFP
jgi:hypothetical protein